MQNDIFVETDSNMANTTEIKLFEDRQVRSVWDEEKGEWYFSVQCQVRYNLYPY